MVESHIEKVTKEEEVITNVICNCCGKSIRSACFCEEDINPLIIRDEYMTINKDWGYFSKWDGETHNVDLCQECCEKIASTFVIPINIQYH